MFARGTPSLRDARRYGAILRGQRDRVNAETLECGFGIVKRGLGVLELTRQNIRVLDDVALLQLSRDSDVLIEPGIYRFRRELRILIAEAQCQEAALVGQVGLQAVDVFNRGLARGRDSELYLALAGSIE